MIQRSAVEVAGWVAGEAVAGETVAGGAVAGGAVAGGAVAGVLVVAVDAARTCRVAEAPMFPPPQRPLMS